MSNYDLSRQRRVIDPAGWLIDLIRQDGLENISNRFYGTYPGRVIDNEDPDKRGRVRLLIPDIGQIDPADVDDDYWARPEMPGLSVGDSGQMHGWFTPPEIGDQVWVRFRNGDTQFPVYGGGTMLKEWEGTELTDAGGSVVKGFRTKTGHVLRFSDDGEDLHILLAKGDGSGALSGSFVTLDKDGGVLLMSENGSNVWLNKEGTLNVINASSDGSEMSSWMTLDNDKVLLGNKSGCFFSMDGGNVTIDAKKDLTLVAGGKFWANSGSVSLGKGPFEPAIRGDRFAKGWCMFHLHTTTFPGSPTGPNPTYPTPFVYNELSEIVRIS